QSLLPQVNRTLRRGCCSWWRLDITSPSHASVVMAHVDVYRPFLCILVQISGLNKQYIHVSVFSSVAQLCCKYQ
uniref:Uncharacterized protein n=1 Tax=Aegilops tauschii subsp. strangulata TaxID=200361 RepID=A0A453B2D4_AEGTS